MYPMDFAIVCTVTVSMNIRTTRFGCAIVRFCDKYTSILNVTQNFRAHCSWLDDIWDGVSYFLDILVGYETVR